MSGGHFDYQEYRLVEIYEEIEKLIANNKKKNEYGYARNYKPETIERFNEAIELLRKAENLVHRIDYLVSGDDGEDTFHEHLTPLT